MIRMESRSKLSGKRYLRLGEAKARQLGDARTQARTRARSPRSASLANCKADPSAATAAATTCARAPPGPPQHRGPLRTGEDGR